MKKKVYLYILVALFSVMIAGCTPGTVVHLNPTVSQPQSGTPTGNGQINIPGVSIDIYAPGPNAEVNTADRHGHPAGILLGIWHGIISPLTMVLSFFNKDLNMYEVHNDGGQYNLGFLVGVAIVFVLLGLFAGSRR
jgi:hypothetical protein